MLLAKRLGLSVFWWEAKLFNWFMSHLTFLPYLHIFGIYICWSCYHQKTSIMDAFLIILIMKNCTEPLKQFLFQVCVLAKTGWPNPSIHVNKNINFFNTHFFVFKTIHILSNIGSNFMVLITLGGNTWRAKSRPQLSREKEAVWSLSSTLSSFLGEGRTSDIG